MIAKLLPEEIALFLKKIGTEAHKERTKNGGETDKYKSLIAQIDEVTKSAKLISPHMYRTD